MKTIAKTKIPALVLPLVMILALGLAACGPGSSARSNGSAQPGTPANEVDMGSYTFVQTGVTISTGQRVHFVDQQNGMAHILCIGKDGRCNAGAQGPQGLTGQGFTIQPGQSHDVPFDTGGTYTVTCTIHPNMNVTITVH